MQLLFLPSLQEHGIALPKLIVLLLRGWLVSQITRVSKRNFDLTF
jgi:hypothetical protein